MVVVPDAVPDPRTVVVKPPDATVAHAAVLGAEGLANHAKDAKVCTVQTALVGKLLNGLFALVVVLGLGDEPGVGTDRFVERERAEGKRHKKAQLAV